MHSRSLTTHWLTAYRGWNPGCATSQCSIHTLTGWNPKSVTSQDGIPDVLLPSVQSLHSQGGIPDVLLPSLHSLHTQGGIPDVLLPSAYSLNTGWNPRCFTSQCLFPKHRVESQMFYFPVFILYTHTQGGIPDMLLPSAYSLNTGWNPRCFTSQCLFPKHRVESQMFYFPVFILYTHTQGGIPDMLLPSAYSLNTGWNPRCFTSQSSFYTHTHRMESEMCYFPVIIPYTHRVESQICYFPVLIPLTQGGIPDVLLPSLHSIHTHRGWNPRCVTSQ